MKNYLLILFIAIFLVGCVDLERVKIIEKQKEKGFKPLAEITCNEVLKLYEECNNFYQYNAIKNCRGYYYPIICKCYGKRGEHEELF
ncbi:MAG: hypothetical protein GY782_08395 [Gammaproteobacteria bacterium]|nr:hypothetical protein [Gammaproteobacteria bacterium]